MRRAIVHIGMPRTGTTTFQRVLADRRAALEAAGVLYPELTPRSASQPHLSHQHLGEALDGRRPPAERLELLSRLEAQLRGTEADVALLSYEGLCWRRRPLGGTATPERLRALFAAAGFAMETLVTVKPQAEAVNSMYTLRTQWLKEARPFAAYLDAQIGSRRLDYDRLLRPWRAVSDGRVSVVPVRDSRSDAPLVARILREIGLADRVALPPADLALVENRSPGPVAVEVSRRLRATGADRRFGGAIRDVTRFIGDAAQARGLDGEAFRGVDADLEARVAAACDASNGRLAGWAWNGPWSARVAAAPPRPVNEIAGHAVPPALRDTLDGLARETLARFEAPGRGIRGLLARIGASRSDD